MAQFTNQAQLFYNNNVTNSNIAVGEILEVLSATKTAVRGEYGQNDSVTYVISIINSGNVAFNGLTVTDNLGAYTSGTNTLVPLTYIDGTIQYYVNGVLQTAPTVTSGTDLAISNISIPANGTVILIYEARVNQFAPLGTNDSITNTAVLSGSGIQPITVAETVETENEPNLSITKSISPVPVTENGVLTYTFLIQNAGNTAVTTTDLAVITDTFDPILTNLNVSFNGATWAEGTNYTYDETTGEFASVAGQITVPAATYTQDETTGAISITPGVSTLVISGTV
ncbi:MAG: hypothetical protein UHS49_01465 [Faecalimonas sp.]|nr:hypothetical protein [Faecalimonas sp.]